MTDPPPASPPPPLSLPVTITGRWKRDWRLSRSLVGKGTLELSQQGVRLTAGTTGVLRSVIVLVVRLLSIVGFCAGCVAALLTAIGLTVRTQTPEWLGSALVAIPLLLAGSMFFGWLVRRVLEGNKTRRIRWSEVERIGVPGGPTIELAVRVNGRRLVGRIRPKRFTVETRTLLQQLRAGHGPAAGATVEVRPLRSRRWDQAVVFGLSLVGMAGLARVAPGLGGRWMGGDPGGPQAGVPARAPASVLEAAPHSCPRGPETGPAVRNRRAGEDLAWSREPEAGWETVHALWQPATGAVEVHRSAEAEGRIAGAFPSADAGEAEVVAISTSVPAAHAAATAHRFESQGLEAGLCSGAVARLDRARHPTEGERDLSLDLRRDGDDLVVEVVGKRRGKERILAARQRDSSRLDWFDRCELAVAGGQLVMPRIDDTLRLPDFFGSSRDAARVVLLAASDADAVTAQLGATALTGSTHCVQVDALAWTGLALAAADTARPDAVLAQAAADLARASPLPTGSSDALVAGLDQRYRQVLAALSPRGRAEVQAVDQGFLDGIAWSAVLDTLSVQHDLAQVERIRQRLSGADPLGNLGELFLLRLAEELLERIPPQADQQHYGDRVDVAEAWLDVSPGKTWNADGRTVTVPSDEVAAYYQVVGHYLLVDVARRVEAHMTRDLVFRVVGLPLRWRLENHGINLDIEKSTAQKALEAWVTGDFEYLGDRALAKVQEQVGDPAGAIAAATGADYRLDGQWSAADGAARTAWLLRDGKEIGWVSLYDQQQVALDFHKINAGGTSRQALGEGRTVLLATAGSYVTADNKTSGLSAIDGSIDNFLISNKMDGLVLFDAAGRLHSLDMRQGGPLPGQQLPIQPLERLADLHQLLRWIEDNDASAFQTHLLGYAGRLTIDERTASQTLRERRLLVQAAYRGHPIVAVVDLPGTPKVSLYEAAVITIQSLRTPEADGGPGLDVVSVANLDVGSYNALSAWSDDGSVLRQSWKPLGETMNLVSVVRR